MPRLVNPNHPDPHRAAIDAAKGDVAAYLAANPDKASVTFDELRQAVPALAGVPDGAIATAAQEAGLEVLHE